MKILYAKAIYLSVCYFVRSQGYITCYLKKTTNGFLVAVISPVNFLSFVSGSWLTLVYFLRNWKQYRNKVTIDILFPMFTK